MKLAAIIIIYNPETNDLCANIKSCIGCVDKLILWQNSDITELINRNAFISIPDFENKVIILGNGDNVGIASGLNAGVEWAAANQYTHLLTMDQDSSFVDGHLLKYKKLIDENKVADIGIFGINPHNGGHLLIDSSEEYVEVPDTITSGSIVPMAVFSEFGGFEDDLFIDAVDYEFCYRLKSLGGLKTIVFPGIVLQHKVGYVTKTWLGFKTDNYSAFRTYYIVRNQTIIWKRYPGMFPRAHKIVLIKTHIINRTIKIILGENDKLNKVRSIFVGLIHGLKGKKGYYKI